MGIYPKFQGSVDKMSNNPYKYFLMNRLLNMNKPIAVGDHVHLTTWDGMYKVYGVDALFFVVMKNREFYRVPWEHLKCTAGLPHSNRKAKNIALLLESTLRTLRKQMGD